MERCKLWTVNTTAYNNVAATSPMRARQRSRWNQSRWWASERITNKLFHRIADLENAVSRITVQRLTTAALAAVARSLHCPYTVLDLSSSPRLHGARNLYLWRSPCHVCILSWKDEQFQQAWWTLVSAITMRPCRLWAGTHFSVCRPNV